jgi:hypothetical protein
MQVIGEKASGMEAWERFVMEHGYRARASELARVLGRTREEIVRARLDRPCRTDSAAKQFDELFSLWHGRAPVEADWPAPDRAGREGYEWQSPEIALMASLVGRLAVPEIARVLTARLQGVTGDKEAKRTETAVQVRINKIGMQASDVVGGVTTSEAAQEVSSLALVQNAIKTGAVKAYRVGRLWVIPYALWESWKAGRVLPPAGYVQLSTLRERLGIASDKLSEFARMGYIPSTVRCTPFGGSAGSTQFGTWYISQEQADKLLADRKAGRAMPWHGKPLADNLKVTYKRWTLRQHPQSCETCRKIWGEPGAPSSFEEYEKRYSPLDRGAKKHLTMVWTPGISVAEVATCCGVAESRVKEAIDNGALTASTHDGEVYVTRTAATRWKARKCPTGDNDMSWMSLEYASKTYLFTVAEIKALIADGTLKSKTGEAGAQRGVVYVLRNQCAEVRARIGFTEEVAAKRVGVTVERFRVLLEGVNWRKEEGIPLDTVRAVIKRLESRQGYTLEECAAEVGMPLKWVKDRVADGTVRVARAKWDRRRLYMTEPMLQRLRESAQRPYESKDLDASNWMRLGEAAREAGVSASTLCNWVEEGCITRQMASNGWRYQKEDVRARARLYWQTNRRVRAKPPAWLAAEGRERAR